MESRWTLGLSAAALFGLGWLFVYVTSLNEAEILRLLESDSEGGGRIQWMRNLGVAERPTSVAIMMAFWNHPFIMLLVLDLGDRPGIGRGVRRDRTRHDGPDLVSAGVALDLSGVSGLGRDGRALVILAAALLAGASIAVRYNVLREPPSSVDLAQARPQSRRPGSADLRLHPAGIGPGPCSLATHIHRVGLDSGRLHRLRHLDDSGPARHELEAMVGADFDLQGV